MLRKVLATAALTASAAGAMAVPAVATGSATSGHDAKSEYGSTKTGGEESPTMTVLQGTLDEPCIALGRLDVNPVALILNIGVQDVPVLTSQQQSQCTQNSTIQDGDDALSHLLDGIPVVSGNGSGNG
ncbi:MULTISPECIES: rodlin [Streptomyces]|uniref:RdlA protein n=1 Tax=Streptomyces morookaense TaxID=1970 RepID=A0A7Y7E7D7_STRMO|nr:MULTISPECIES: rodlin [Streptomyces]MCC2274073.1 RdlA protein [Streptomyces sp. ET3-23]NVK78873.1 RdlA protein [Streptomyces morookaense]